MICMKNQRFSSRPRAKVRRQGPPGSARAQPCPKEQLTKLFDLLIMSLFLYGIEIWRAAYQGKYLDRIDKFFKQAFRFRYTNKLYAIAEVIRNRDCKLWNTITDTPSHPLYQLLLPKKQRFL